MSIQGGVTSINQELDAKPRGEVKKHKKERQRAKSKKKSKKYKGTERNNNEYKK